MHYVCVRERSIQLRSDVGGHKRRGTVSFDDVDIFLIKKNNPGVHISKIQNRNGRVHFLNRLNEFEFIEYFCNIFILIIIIKAHTHSQITHIHGTWLARTSQAQAHAQAQIQAHTHIYIYTQSHTHATAIRNSKHQRNSNL